MGLSEASGNNCTAASQKPFGHDSNAGAYASNPHYTNVMIARENAITSTEQDLAHNFINGL